MPELQTGISYFANRWVHHFNQDLDDIVSHSCTFVVHTFSENDLLFARGTLGKFFRATRDAGLGCWADPWGVMGLFGGEAICADILGLFCCHGSTANNHLHFVAQFCLD
jgi:hypothetical protein